MDDYISRMVVLNEAEHTKMYDERDHKTMVAMLRTCPAADVRPVKVGHWIRHISDLFPADSTMECDQCHEEQPIGIDDNFCPNCGADMREESA